jgi:acyl-CoA thioester hydrolase
MIQHAIPIRVYYEDTDAGGIVYYANYMKFCERGRTEYLRFCGFEHKSLKAEKGMIFVVRRLEAEYYAPSHLDDELTVRTSVGEVKNASFAMTQEILRGEAVVFEMTVWLVCINLEGRPVGMPADMKKALGKE